MFHFSQGFNHRQAGYINIIGANNPVPSFTLHPNQVEKFFSDDTSFDFRYGVLISSRTDIYPDHLEVMSNSAECSAFIKACYAGIEPAKLDEMLKTEEVQKRINSLAACGMNGFMIACLKGHTEIVSLLLKCSFDLELDVNAKDKKKGQSGLTKAVREGHLEIVKLLTKDKSIDIDLNTRDHDMKTPFMHACESEFTDIVDYFLKLAESKKSDKFDLNAKEKNGNTAFHLACISKNEDIVNLIMESAAKLKIEPDLKNNLGKTGCDLWPEKFEEPETSKRPRLEDVSAQQRSSTDGSSHMITDEATSSNDDALAPDMPAILSPINTPVLSPRFI